MIVQNRSSLMTEELNETNVDDMKNPIEHCRFNASELISYLLSPKHSRIIYRGISNSDFALVPNAYRNDGQLTKKIAEFYLKKNKIECEINTAQAELTILKQFYDYANHQGIQVPSIPPSHSPNQIEIFKLINTSFENWLEIASLAQHYGLPTRLLDWTYNPWVALYFATKNQNEKQSDFALWELIVDHFVDMDNIRIITPKYHGNPNITAQSGVFTTYVGKEYSPSLPLDQIVRKDFEKTNLYKKYSNRIILMKKITIPSEDVDKIRCFINDLGYQDHTVFPGLDGIVKQMKDESLKTESHSIEYHTMLSDKYVVDMLLFLLESGKVEENKLMDVVKNYYTAVDVATKLVDNNLVDSWMEKDSHTVKVYELTALGSEVARDLKHANDRLNGIMPESQQSNHGSPEVEGSEVRS